MRVYNSLRGNLAVCKALGLDPSNVRSISIEFAPNSLPNVFVSFLVDTKQVEEIAAELQHYVLVEASDSSDAVTGE